MDAGGEIEAETGRRGGSAPLDSLLERLAQDREVAPAYEQLRMRLVIFFRLRFPTEAESLADVAIDRLARRLNDGTQIDDLGRYVLGIARFLVLETNARRRKEIQAARETMRRIELHSQDPEPDAPLSALRACLESIDPKSAGFILEYYAVETDTLRIDRRRRLAERLGISLNALRNRALRTRIALEKCVRARLAGAAADSLRHIPTADSGGAARYPIHDCADDDVRD